MIYAFIQFEACLIASGISYRSKTEKEPENFNSIRCTQFRKLFFGQSVLDIIANWNLVVQRWLKYYIYLKLIDRDVPRGTYQLKAFFCTFIVSAVWHGFYPGYYFALLSIGLAGLSFNKFEKSIVHYKLEKSCNGLLFKIVKHIIAVNYVAYSVEFNYAKSWSQCSNWFWNLAYCSLVMSVASFVIFSILPRAPRDKDKQKVDDMQKSGEVKKND